MFVTRMIVWLVIAFGIPFGLGAIFPSVEPVDLLTGLGIFSIASKAPQRASRSIKTFDGRAGRLRVDLGFVRRSVQSRYDRRTLSDDRDVHLKPWP